MRADVVSAAVDEANAWLEAQLREERSEIGRLVDQYHRDLLVRFKAQVESRLAQASKAAAAVEAEAEAAAETPVADDSAKPGAVVASDPGAKAELEQKSTEDELPQGRLSRLLSSSLTVDVALPARSDSVLPENMFKDESGVSEAHSGNTSALSRLVTSHCWEVFFDLLILFSGVVMALQRQYEGERTAHMLNYQGAPPASEDWPDATETFEALEWAVGCLFILEVIVKMAGLRRTYFTQSLWNDFDLLIVVLWIVDRSSMVPIWVNPVIMRMIRVGRLARLVRIMRWLQVMDPLVLMVKAIRASATALFWSLLLLSLVIGVFAMVVGGVLEPFARDETNQREARIAVFQEWGTFSRASFTMWEITLANWGPPVRRLMDNVTEWWALLFVAYKLTIGFAVVQVIISVFIQQTFKVASRDAEVLIKEKAASAVAYKKNAERLFEYLDASHDGLVSREEFLEMTEDKRVRTWFGALDIDADEVSMLFDLLDEGEGRIDHQEFVHGMTMLKGNAARIDMLLLSRSAKRTSELMTQLDGKVDNLASELADVKRRGVMPL